MSERSERALRDRDEMSSDAVTIPDEKHVRDSVSIGESLVHHSARSERIRSPHGKGNTNAGRC